jgi:predicted transcriptional regulator
MNLTDSKSVHELFFESLYSLFRPVVIAVTILLFVLISYNLSKSDQITLNQALAQPEVSLEQLLNPVEFLIED